MHFAFALQKRSPVSATISAITSTLFKAYFDRGTKTFYVYGIYLEPRAYRALNKSLFSILPRDRSLSTSVLHRLPLTRAIVRDDIQIARKEKRSTDADVIRGRRCEMQNSALIFCGDLVIINFNEFNKGRTEHAAKFDSVITTLRLMLIYVHNEVQPHRIHNVLQLNRAICRPILIFIIQGTN